MKAATHLTLLIALLTVSVSGCTRGKDDAAAIPVGDSKPVFAFDWKYAQSLTLAKADPMSGDHWMARVDRQQEKPTRFYENDTWQIQSYSENSGLLDRLANRNYILHLLDTLSTLHVLATVDSDGDSETVRASYGLNPPRYALRWKVWDVQTQASRDFQVEIGNLVDPAHPMQKESYGVFPPSHKIYRIDGAAIAMLDYLKGFVSIRQEVLSPLTSDDVDEIEIYRGAKKILYAQRDGERWTNEQHRPWKKDVGGFLDRITHLRVMKFVDTEADAAPLRADLEKHLAARIVVKDRFGKPTEFKFAKTDGRELGEISNRSSAVFELYPSALDKLEP